ncbi:MAG TPA: gamma-glutamyl-gamma-aminobutyrate hydrolase family protein [Capillimicrobium sp.]|jgi:CTP synthase (UTP-ammonia lyase)
MTATIAVLADRDEALLTHREIDAALALLPDGVCGEWVATDDPRAHRLDAFDGLWVGPGTPYRDAAAVLAAIAGAWRTGQPLLATCGGFQHVCLAAVPGSQHAESDPDAHEPLVAPLACSLVGETRPVTARPGSRLAAAMGTEPFAGFHWCRFGVAPALAHRLEAAGLRITATAPDAGVEALELAPEAHPFFVATLFQPQVGCAKAGELPPLLAAFAAASSAASSAT